MLRTTQPEIMFEMHQERVRQAQIRYTRESHLTPIVKKVRRKRLRSSGAGQRIAAEAS